MLLLKIEENVGNIKKIWNLMNGLMGKEKSKSPEKNLSQDRSLVNHDEIATSFNQCFSNVTSNLERDIQPSVHFTEYLPELSHFSFFLCPTTCHGIESLINSLKKLLRVMTKSI